jgi:hypothetical protein
MSSTAEETLQQKLPEFEPVAPVQAEAPAEEASDESEDRSLADGETEFEWNSVAAELCNDSASEDAMQSERGFTFETVVAEELPPPSDELVAASSQEDEDRHSMIRAQELESVDFYIAQGYTDIAVDTLDLLERRSEHEDIRRRKQLNILANGGTLEAEPEQPIQCARAGTRRRRE